MTERLAVGGEHHASMVFPRASLASSGVNSPAGMRNSRMSVANAECWNETTLKPGSRPPVRRSFEIGPSHGISARGSRPTMTRTPRWVVVRLRCHTAAMRAASRTRTRGVIGAGADAVGEAWPGRSIVLLNSRLRT